MGYLPTLADLWLGRYYMFEPADSYRHATASSLIPCDSSRPTDSNGALPDSIRLLAVELPSGLYFWSRAGTLRLFAAECYKHATASSLTLLNISRRAESNELSPDPGGPLAGELSPF